MIFSVNHVRTATRGRFRDDGMAKTDDTVYLKALLYHYEAEIVGEAYFYALADCFDDAAERGETHPSRRSRTPRG